MRIELNHDAATALAFTALLTFVGFLCWLFGNGWPLLIMLGGTFSTERELEARIEKVKRTKESETNPEREAE